MKHVIQLLLAAVGIGIGLVLGEAGIRKLLLRARPPYFEGKVILITGASRGIGRALAHAFAKTGAQLVLAARDQRQLLAVASECGAIRLGVQTLVVPTDISSEDDLHNLVRMTLDRFGRIDILINNAGILEGGSFHQMSPLSIKRQIDVNLVGTMLLTRLVLPHMLAQGRSQVVIMSSHAGRVSFPFFTPYTTTKYALRGFANNLRPELAGSGISVTSVYPGFVDTEMVDETQAVARRMLLPVLTAETVAQRTLEGIHLGQAEVNFGWFETFGGWVAAVAPRLIDLYWRVIAPRDFAKIAARQRSR